MADKRRDAAINRVKDGRMEITDQGLRNIAAWTYHGGAYTPLDNLLNKFIWTPGVNLLPIWLAPNAVTFIGLLWPILGYAVLVGYYCPDFSLAAPRWTYVFAAFTHFVYQTMDAWDGKQARRTGSSSALGQLFDHGCDSVSTTFIGLAICAGARLEFGPRSLITMISLQLPFWMSQWEEYHTHTMEHSLGGWIGITEGQIAGMLFIATSTIMGPEFWMMTFDSVTLPGWYCNGAPCPLTPRDLALGTQCSVASVFVFTSFKRVLLNAENKRTAMLQTGPIFILMALGFSWCTLPHAHPRLVLFSLGMAFTHLTNKMIVAGMCKMHYHIHTGWQCLWPLPVIYVIARTRILPRHDDVILGAYCCYCVYKLLKYIRNVVEEISEYLGIYVFTLGPRQDEKDD